MSQEKQPTPISKARAIRASSPKIETTSAELRQILSEVVDQKVAAKITRLEKSINRMMDHIESVRSGDAQDSALRVTTDNEATDLALANINLPLEEYYPYTCDLLAEKLGIKRYQALTMIKNLKLRGVEKYHTEMASGKKSKISKWSNEAYYVLKKHLVSGDSSSNNNAL
jgi:hypothetical protein